MPDPVPLLTESTCRTLSVRQAQSVLILTVAAVEELPETPLDHRRSATARVSATLADLGLLVVDEPELAAAGSSAMLASDPDVRLLGDRIGVEMRRLRLALGDDVDPAVLRSIELTVTGALVQAGMGHSSYRRLPDRLTEAAALLLAGAR